MKYPLNEKQFETAVNAAYKKAGYWVHHMETNIPGFPDTLIARRGSVHIEYKYIKPSDAGRRAVSFFESSQPGQLLSMASRGMRVRVVIYSGGIVYWADITPDLIKALLEKKIIDLLALCNEVYYEVFLRDIK